MTEYVAIQENPVGFLCKPGDRRITVQTLAAGQPRAYADTIRHVRVFFEWVPYTIGAHWEANDIQNIEMVREYLKGLCCGFTDFEYPPKDRAPTMEDHFRTRLDWLRHTGVGVWEFHTTSAYTD